MHKYFTDFQTFMTDFFGRKFLKDFLDRPFNIFFERFFGQTFLHISLKNFMDTLFDRFFMTDLQKDFLTYFSKRFLIDKQTYNIIHTMISYRSMHFLITIKLICHSTKQTATIIDHSFNDITFFSHH